MSEIKELKPGESQVYEVKGKKLFLEPIPMGRLKKLSKLIFSAIDELGKSSAVNDSHFFKKLPEIFDDKVNEILPLLFDLKKHEFLSRNWIDENITIPLVKRIYSDAVAINGLESFFGRMGTHHPRPSTMPGKTHVQTVQTR